MRQVINGKEYEIVRRVFGQSTPDVKRTEVLAHGIKSLIKDGYIKETIEGETYIAEIIVAKEVKND